MRIHYADTIAVTERIKIILETSDSLRMKVTFDNGITASVIKTPGSYGSSEGLFEMAIFENSKLVGDDPYGWLDVLDVLLGLAQLHRGNKELQ